jgi:tetratricopeptide (TPR) repeat protein
VLAYYQRQDTKLLSDGALAQRSKALTLMGDIAQRRGDLARATRLYQTALAGTAEAARRDPNNPQRLFDHAQNVFFVGDLARQTGQLERAERAFAEYKQLADRMIALDPGDVRWQLERQYATGNLGIIFFAQRRFPQAVQTFKGKLPGDERLAEGHPTNAEHQLNRLETLAWLADSQLAAGRLGEALASRRRQLELLGRLQSAADEDVVLLQKEIPARRGLGRLLAMRGEAAPALREITGAAALAQRLVSKEPGNMVWQELAAGAQLELSGLLLDLGEESQATAAAEAGCGKVSRLAAQGGALTEWRSLHIECLSVRARVAVARGKPGEALIFAGQALAAAEAQLGGTLADRRLTLASVHRLIGNIHQQAGDGEAAGAAFKVALGLWPTIVERPGEMALHTDLLLKAGRANEAVERHHHLRRIGFRQAP